MYGKPIKQTGDVKFDLAWFKDRIGKEICKNLKLVHEVKKITILDEQHAEELFVSQKILGSDFFEKI